MSFWRDACLVGGGFVLGVLAVCVAELAAAANIERADAVVRQIAMRGWATGRLQKLHEDRQG